MIAQALALVVAAIGGAAVWDLMMITDPMPGLLKFMFGDHDPFSLPQRPPTREDVLRRIGTHRCPLCNDARCRLNAPVVRLRPGNRDHHNALWHQTA